MRVFVSTVLLLLSAGVYAGANCNGTHNCNEISGGDGGNAYQGQKAYGGDADQDQWQVGINKNVNINDLNNKQYQGQGQQQGQGQIGINKAVGAGNSTTISSSTKVDAEPAIAPAIAPGDPTAPCYVTYGGSAAGGGVAALGFSAYKYDTICGALEFYRTAGQDSDHAAEAKTLVTVAYHNLLNQMQVEMGDTEFNKAMGAPPEGEATSAEYTYPAQDGGFMKVSFERVGQAKSLPGSEDKETARDITQPLR
jgi:hypothetical protein